MVHLEAQVQWVVLGVAMFSCTLFQQVWTDLSVSHKKHQKMVRKIIVFVPNDN